MSLETKTFNNEIMSLDTYIMFKLKEITAKLTPELTSRGRKPISLSMGAPSANPPKFVIDKLKEYLDKDGIHSYSIPKGEKPFRDAISVWMKRRFSVDMDSDKEIFSLIGSKEGIANLVRFVTTPKENEFEKDIILVPDPCYASYLQFIKCSGAKGYPIPLTKENNYMPDLDKVFDKLQKDGYDKNRVKLVIVNYPNNPLGVGATREYLQSVVDFCKRENILLASDLAYSELYFDEKEKPFSIFELEGAKDIAVEFHSLSKPYAMTGWRLGWICGNEEAVKIFGKLKSTLDSGIFKALQKAGSVILTSEEGDKYIEEANKNFKKNQQIFVNGLKELGWDDFYVPEATFYLWIPIPPRYKTSVEFTDDLMNKSGVIMVPGSGFGEYGEGYCRVSIVCSEEKLKEAIERMKTDGFYFN